MPVDIKHIDTFQTRFFQSFVNLTKYNSSTYPATSTINVQNFETGAEALTSIQIYDQWALRIITDKAPLL